MSAGALAAAERQGAAASAPQPAHAGGTTSPSNAPPTPRRSNSSRSAQFHPALNNPTTSAAGSAARSGAALNAGFEATFRKEDFKPLPNQIHMVWVGSKPGDSQLKYAKNWAEKNPHADVNIWLDSRQLGAYEENKKVGQELDKLFPDKKAFQTEKLFRGLFSQLHASMSKHGPEHKAGCKQALSELNKELYKPANAALKRRLVPVGNVTEENAADVRLAFKELSKGNDEKFLLAERMVLDQTTKAWDRASQSKEPVGQDHAALSEIQAQLNHLVPKGNAKIRDLSNPDDMPVFTNRKAYQHGIVGRNGAYPEASDIARYAILHHAGGTYADIDLECTKSLEGLSAHPDLMLVGLDEGKGEASGGKTPYFANALLSSHPGGKAVKSMVDAIGAQYDDMKGNEYSGARYFDRPNKSTIENTGPNGLREQIDKTVRAANGDPVDARANPESRAERVWSQDNKANDAFWSAVRSHIAFPEGLVNFETEEQQQSATKDMA